MTSKGKSFCVLRAGNGGRGWLEAVAESGFSLRCCYPCERFVKNTLRQSEDKIGGNRFGRAPNTALFDLAG